MKNEEIYNINPQKRKLENQGVADVNSISEEILRYELETFVCDGQYAEGMKHVLRTFLDNLGKVEQPAVWVSGFYGSGKSHLVKMMAALWTDHQFQDKAKARDIAELPEDIKELYKELSVQGRRHGGLHAAIGTLSSGAYESVRMLILCILFKSVGLPTNYEQAKLILWLRRQDIEKQVKAKVQELGGDWLEEISNMYVAKTLHEALMAVRPETFASAQSCADALVNMFPHQSDVSNDEMVAIIHNVLAHDAKLPLTMLVLDEMQQFIGENTDRALLVQEAIQTCSKAMQAKLLVVATGQTGITGTACLNKIEGRFTVRIELSDTDIDAVIRKVILAKRPESIKAIGNILQDNIGEISRHLAGSQLAYKANDEQYLIADYPILPTRRRFWERTLQKLDQTGTDSQLRNMLSMNLKMIQANADLPLGHVSPGDFLFFDLADKLLQSRILPRPTYEKIIPWYRNGTEDEKLTARACGLVFLINKLVFNEEKIGLAATVDVIADLMVEDLKAGSMELRKKLPALLDGCKELMKIGDEYRIQTPESLEWANEFANQQNTLKQDSTSIETERGNRLLKHFNEECPHRQLAHGKSKVARNILLEFNKPVLSSGSKNAVTIWIRDGWMCSEETVRTDARQAGLESHIIFGFIPKINSDNLRKQIIDFKAAENTLALKGVPSTPEGQEAYSAMMSTCSQAELKIKDLIKDNLDQIIIYQGGGNEVQGISIQDKISEAAKVALTRLYPNFDQADAPEWGKVYDKARTGVPDALKLLQFNGEAKEHPVCKQFINFIGAGKSGTEIRDHFEMPPFGWSRDVTDGALQVLLASGDINAFGANGAAIDQRKLERKAIGATRFKLEAVVVSAKQKIELRKLFQKVGMTVSQEELLSNSTEFLEKVETLALMAGGDAPRPVAPDLNFLKDVKLTAGNEQLMLIYNLREDLEAKISQWQDLKTAIEARIDNWTDLQKLADLTAGLDEATPLLAQVIAVKEQRLLLNEPDMVIPLVKSLSDICRRKLDGLKAEYDTAVEKGESQLEADSNWKQLESNVRDDIRASSGVRSSDLKLEVKQSSVKDILNTLSLLSFQAFNDKVAALPGRYAQALKAAAKALEPAVQYNPALPSRMLKTEEDVDIWLEETGSLLKDLLKNGPIQI